MRKIKLFTLLAAALMTANMWAATGSWTSGVCTVELAANGTLTISGTGAMEQFTPYPGGFPWLAYCEEITSIVVEEGVTELPTFGAMYTGCSNLETVSLPSSLTNLGFGPFHSCANLRELEMKATTPPSTVYGDELTGMHADFKILCPSGSVSAYANSYPWIKWWDYLYDASTSTHAALPHGAGNCGVSGANLTWDFTLALKDGGNPNKLADYEGTLTISGSGEMDQYDLSDPHAPWADLYSYYIHHIAMNEGITTITGGAFAQTPNVKTYIIPSTVTYIGPDAFWACENPEAEVYISANPATLEWWDNEYDPSAEMDPDDFLYWTLDEWGNDVWHVQATKCFVPSEYLSAYKAKWAKNPDTEYTNVNVFFASKLWDGETKAGIEKILDDTDGQEVPVVTVTRPMNRDGYFATLCFPFDLSAAQIAKSSLHGAEIKEFTNATVDGGTLNIEFSLVDHIEAGKPYFIKFTNPELKGDALDRLDFMEVTIDKTAPTPVTHGGLTMTGTYVPKAVEEQTDASDGEGVLFLGANNTLYWPNKAGTIKPFRAYFSISGGGPAHIRRGMPAQIVENDNPEGINNTNAEKIAVKAIQNGMLIIEKNGVRYNAQGQIVK